MKVFKLFENDTEKKSDQTTDEATVRKLSREEFNSLPAWPTAGNIGEQFRSGRIAFDNVAGLGATPYNQEVAYFGFAAMMKPSDFLKLATAADRGEDAAKLVDLMHDHTPIACPFLQILFDDEAYKKDGVFDVRVRGHEGRARMRAIMKIQGDKPVPVHFILMHGARARHLSAEFFEDLRTNGMLTQDRSGILVPEFGKIFWLNKALTPKLS